MRVTYYVASSLDGFIADGSGSVGWLDELGIAPEDSGFEAFFAGVDGLVMGRRTWDQVRGIGPWPYADKPAWVCSRKPLEAASGITLQYARDPAGVIEQAEACKLDHLWVVGGGSLASAFLQEGLLTHLSVSLMPRLLGDGIPLFGEAENVPLEPGNVTPMKGFCQLEYRIAAT